jgi:hypothetical protein
VRSRLAFGALVVGGAIASCATASGGPEGGDLTPAGRDAATPPPFDAGIFVDAAVIEKLCLSPAWSDLYRNLFGPTGRGGSCSFERDCHGTPEGSGARSGSGIECYDERGCCVSLFEKGLIRPSNFKQPEKAFLFGILRRQVDGGRLGIMPKEPSDYVFSPESLESIREWIRSGAAEETESKDSGGDATNDTDVDAAATGDATDEG